MDEQDLVGRGGLKLQAGLERFAVDVRGARAIDIGASTGGFTEVLLRHGAAHVTAIDVGHGQLHPRLREDPRVTSLEKTDFKRLSVHEASGPFDVFVVDVSFVAARSMLRGLAFRLRDGAEGVVLVKPQFELPDQLVRGGDVSDPALRARALATFTAKAEALGFEIRQSLDSPVAGGSGTVEILAHLRFRGRTEKLPGRPGEEARPKRTPTRRARKDALPAVLRWYAVAAPGLEEVGRAEVDAIPGVSAVETVVGGTEFSGPLEVGMAANLHLRVATRVLLRLGQVRAREFPKLRHLLAKLPWAAAVPPAQNLRVDASATRCRLYHTGAVAEQVALAIGDRLGRVPPLAEKRPPHEDEGEAGDEAPTTRVLVRGAGDVWTVSVDSSGALLHRRGYRPESGPAPLRETLAAGLLALAGHDPARPFLDPMCGAGTIVLEAASRALGRAPGLGRRFAFESWPGFDAGVWARLQDEARGGERAAVAAAIVGHDRDERAVEVARRNAARAGLAAQVQLSQAGLGQASVPEGPGLVIVNPPYGRRLGTPAAAARLIGDLGRLLRRQFRGWRAGVLLADRNWLRTLGLRPVATHQLHNGGLRVTFVIVDVDPR